MDRRATWRGHRGHFTPGDRECNWCRVLAYIMSKHVAKAAMKVKDTPQVPKKGKDVKAMSHLAKPR